MLVSLSHSNPHPPCGLLYTFVPQFLSLSSVCIIFSRLLADTLISVGCSVFCVCAREKAFTLDTMHVRGCPHFIYILSIARTVTTIHSNTHTYATIYYHLLSLKLPFRPVFCFSTLFFFFFKKKYGLSSLCCRLYPK